MSLSKCKSVPVNYFKVYSGVEAWLHPFLNSAPDKVEQLG